LPGAQGQYSKWLECEGQELMRIAASRAPMLAEPAGSAVSAESMTTNLNVRVSQVRDRIPIDPICTAPQ
jgi:hypothetical protein